tara:strand:- start:205 stop:546 length:342 start_codon:yes stop_codon:yes gene_type:complete
VTLTSESLTINLAGQSIGTITGVFERKSEYRISSFAGLFDERVAAYDQYWLNITRICGYWLTWSWAISQRAFLFVTGINALSLFKPLDSGKELVLRPLSRLFPAHSIRWRALL